MAESEKNDPGTAALSRADLVAQFEAGWRATLTGGPRPSVPETLNRVPPAERTALRAELERIERDYLRRLAAAGDAGATVGFSPDGDTRTNASEQPAVATLAPSPAPDAAPANGPGATLAFRPEPRTVQPQATIGFTPDAPPAGAPAPPGPTLTPTLAAALGQAGPILPTQAPGVAGGSVVDFSLAPEVKEGVRDDDTVVPGYEVLGELGRGGMGVVYKARQRRLNRLVALKMVLSGAHASLDQLARFATEAEVVARFRHPHIVQIFDVGEHKGLPYFSLEFVEGGSLRRKIGGRPQPPAEAAAVLEKLADAMAYAHAHDIIHRDLKPDNVLLTADGEPKVTDFGLAKRLEDDCSQTKSGTLMGTPSYMAPEQARGEIRDVGPLADVYSLGAILYELLTGRPPFQGTTVLETLEMVRTKEPIAPRQLQPTVPRDLETICLKCLQKEAKKRYTGADELAADLKRFRNNEPILARPVSPRERAWRWCKRNPRIAILLGTIAALLLLGVAGTWVAYYEIAQEKQEADRQRAIADQKAKAEKLARDEADRNAEKARQAEKLAGEQAQLALSTIYDVVTTADEKLRPKADMGPLRKELLQLVMKRLDKISKDAATSGRADRTMGVALQRMGEFYSQMGMTAQQIEVYKRSLGIFERLIADHQDEDWNRFNAAISYDSLGEIGREIEPDPAKLFEPYEKSLELRKPLVVTVHQPELSLFRRQRALATSYVKLATLALTVGDPARAEEYAREALGQSQALAAATPEEQNNRREVISASYMTLARATLRRGHEAEARDALQHCIELRQQMVQADATNALAKQELARAFTVGGDLEMETGHTDAARAAYQKAHDLFARMVEKDAGNPELAWYLANVNYALGAAQQALHDPGARAALEACLKTRRALLKDDPNNPERKIELMLVLARLGQTEEAAKLAAEIQAYGPKHPGMLFAVAGTYALCLPSTTDTAKKARYADLAGAALREAVAHGWHDLRGLTTDPDLAPLRDTAGFKAVVARLQGS